MRQVARVRLAVIALKEGDPEEIRNLARAEGDDGFSSHFQELLGDALVANGDLEGARTGVSGGAQGGYGGFSSGAIDYGENEHDPKG